MALSAGTITIDSETGAHSGSGMAYTMLDTWWASKSSEYSGQSVDFIVSVKEAMAQLLRAMAQGVVSSTVEVVASWSPGSVAPGATAHTSIAMAGLSASEPVAIHVWDSVSAARLTPALSLTYWSTTDTLNVYLHNPTAVTAIDPGTLEVRARRLL